MRVSTGSKPKTNQMPTMRAARNNSVAHGPYQQVYRTLKVPVSTIGLKKALSLQKVSAKAHTMQRRKTMFANGLDVLGTRIAFRFGQMVLGILGIVLDHHLSRVTFAMMDAAAIQAILHRP